MLGVPVTLVAGNHDRVHPYYGERAERFINVYQDKCRLANLVLTNTRLRLADGTEVQVSHFPYPDPALAGREDRHGHLTEDKFAPWRPVDGGGWLLCGHVHSSWRQRGRQINVGVDAWGGRPVSEDTLTSLIEQSPADREPLPWDWRAVDRQSGRPRCSISDRGSLAHPTTHPNRNFPEPNRNRLY